MKFQYLLPFLVYVIIIENSKQTEQNNGTRAKQKQKLSLWSWSNVFAAMLEDSTILHDTELADQTDSFNLQLSSSSKHDIQRRKRSAIECYNLTSCDGRCSEKRMFHNIKENKNVPACYCDRECDEVFTDCCADFAQICGIPRKIPSKKIHKDWNCFNIKKFPFEIWMIAGCKPDWPQKDPNVKNCAKFSETNPKASWITPVFGGKTTYRNQYCALCNGVKNFQNWKIKKIECRIKAPAKYTDSEKLKHYDKYCDASSIKFKQTRGIRYCYSVERNCQYSYDRNANKVCENGMTALVSSQITKLVYRNRGCYLCNQRKNDQAKNVTCGPQVVIGRVGQIRRSPSVIILTSIFGGRYGDTLEIPGSTTVTLSPKCSRNQIYDNAAKLCRNLFFYNSTSDSFLSQFAVRLLFKQTKNSSCSAEQIGKGNTTNVSPSLVIYLRKKFDGYLAKSNENKSIPLRFHDLEVHINENKSFVFVTFQILRVRSYNESLKSHFFLEELQIGEIKVDFVNGDACFFVLTKIQTKELVCLDNRTYPVNMKDLRTENGIIHLNTTEVEYITGQYLVFQYQNETRIALCRDTKPKQCLYHLQVKNESHWKMFFNRSIYTLVTRSWFHYGEYSLVNGTLWLCLTKNHTTQTQRILRKSTSPHSIILSYGTLVCYSVSIFSLVVLLVVYSLFSQLRNLPGKNLMLFSAILALAQTAWLTQIKIASRWHGICPTINIILQYLFLATFSCSLSIAIHSFRTFNALAKGKLRQRAKGGTFLKYAMLALGFPFLFVMVCRILDTNNVVPLNYGTSDDHCWFATKSTLFIAFLYPAFLLLLCNLIFFFATLRVIYKCTKASQKLAEKSAGANKKHVGIYIRMSTVMGFTWLFGVLNIFFPNMIAFQYTFVFVNGFQGLYLSFAFLSTANVRKIVFGRSGKEADSLTKSFRDTTIKQEISTTDM